MITKYFTENEAIRKGANHQLLTWMRDNAEGTKIVENFHKQVLMNKGRISVPVRNGGLVSLFVNKIAL